MASTALVERARSRLAFALDYPDLPSALAGARHVVAHVGVLKLGLELFVRSGSEGVRSVADVAAEAGAHLFLDLKLHDIPETVARAVEGAAALGVRFLTVHASGGSAMLARAQASAGATELLAVTVLTSLDDHDLQSVGVTHPVGEQVLRLGTLATQAGVPGLVCAPSDAPRLRAHLGPAVRLVTPGIRPAFASAGDQKRVATPAAALAAGADLLVIGRPLRDAPSPADAARALLDEVLAFEASLDEHAITTNHSAP
jgi:orotidine-5'-phosphate decarboxylase